MQSLSLLDLVRSQFVYFFAPNTAWAQVPGAAPPATPAPAATEGGGATAVAALMLVVLLAIIVGGVKLYDLKRKRDEDAMILDAQIADAVLVHPHLKNFPIGASIHTSIFRRSIPVVEVSGTVATDALRELAIDIVKGEMRRHGLDATVQDHIVVDPRIVGRVA